MSHYLSVSWMVILEGADAATCQRENGKTELHGVGTLNVNYLKWKK